MNANKQRVKPNIVVRQLEMRQNLWPQYSEADLWLRKVRDGFTTVPRTMPLIFQIMDVLSKGKPVSATYFDLWCRAFDECFIVLNKAKEMAFSSGFAGQRAEQTWLSRISILNKLGFINTQPGPSGPVSYAIILNPYKVIKSHHQKNEVTDELYNALLMRSIEIGANDLTENDSSGVKQVEPVPPSMGPGIPI
jgi:hypothetical protein